MSETTQPRKYKRQDPMLRALKAFTKALEASTKVEQEAAIRWLADKYKAGR